MLSSLLTGLLTSALALALLSAGPAKGWDGVYSYTQDGGRTAGGSPILVTWRLTLKNGACEFHGEGFQTLETMQCSTHATPEGLEVRFVRYPPPAKANRFGVEVYKPGAPLFTLGRPRACAQPRRSGT